MAVLIFISSYIATIFLGRYIDIKVQLHIHNIHYKQHLLYGIWFIPIVNVLFPLVPFIEHEINTRKQDIKHNKFINWFFVGVNYKTDKEIKEKNEFDHFFKLPTLTSKLYEERNMTNNNEDRFKE